MSSVSDEGGFGTPIIMAVHVVLQIEHMSLTSAAQALGFLFGSVIGMSSLIPSNLSVDCNYSLPSFDLGGLLSVCDFSIFGLPVNANTVIFHI